KRGLIYAATPASDFVCGTQQVASGITVQVFTTGRGTPYGLMSSVYGLNRKMPFSTEDSVDHPVSLYAATKKANELMA
ncbi:UxaA family hydrolase, partial [Escherichia coli]